MNFLDRIQAYFYRNPVLLSAIVAGLIVFAIATLAASILCPPAILAIAIGGVSLVGAILPITAAFLLVSFTLLEVALVINSLTRSPVQKLADALSPLMAMSQPEGADKSQNVAHFPSPVPASNAKAAPKATPEEPAAADSPTAAL